VNSAADVISHCARGWLATWCDLWFRKPAPGWSANRILKVFQGIFVDPMISQYRGLQSTLKEFPADVVIHETCFTGVIPMLLDPSSERPASVYLGGHSTTPRTRRRSPVGSGTAADRGSGRCWGCACTLTNPLSGAEDLTTPMSLSRLCVVSHPFRALFEGSGGIKGIPSCC